MSLPLPLDALPGLSDVWRADALAHGTSAVVATGSSVLDAQLPGGGWPVGAIVEILQAHTVSHNISNTLPNSGRNSGGNGALKGGLDGGHCEWRLLLPALKRLGLVSMPPAVSVNQKMPGGWRNTPGVHVQAMQVQATAQIVALVGAPHAPFCPGLAGQGLDTRRLLCINTTTSASRLWATEQALRCADVAAVLAWFPHVGPGQVRSDQLRRLQMAAAAHTKLLFVMRPARAQDESSPAALRLLAALQTDGDALVLHILKRRGPPLSQPLLLPARPARLAALLAVQSGLAGRPGQADGDEAARVGKTAKMAKMAKMGQMGQMGQMGKIVQLGQAAPPAPQQLRPQPRQPPALPATPATPATIYSLPRVGHALDRATAVA